MDNDKFNNLVDKVRFRHFEVNKFDQRTPSFQINGKYVNLIRETLGLSPTEFAFIFGIEEIPVIKPERD